jgi:hypothetical protein
MKKFFSIFILSLIFLTDTSIGGLVEECIESLGDKNSSAESMCSKIKNEHSLSCIKSLKEASSYSTITECTKVNNEFSARCTEALGKNVSYSTINECLKINNEFSAKCTEGLGKDVSYSTINECTKITNEFSLECAIDLKDKSYSGLSDCVNVKEKKMETVKLAEEKPVDCLTVLMSEPSCVDRLNATDFCDKNPRTELIKLVQNCIQNGDKISGAKNDRIALCLGGFRSSSNPKSKESFCNGDISKPIFIDDSSKGNNKASSIIPVNKNNASDVSK